MGRAVLGSMLQVRCGVVFDATWRKRAVDIPINSKPRKGYNVKQIHHDDPDQRKNISNIRYEPSYIKFSERTHREKAWKLTKFLHDLPEAAHDTFFRSVKIS